jgi:hypothetical protein
MDVEVKIFPDDVQKKFAEASKTIQNKEMAKGDTDKKGGEALTKLMYDLGYV